MWHKTLMSRTFSDDVHSEQHQHTTEHGCGGHLAGHVLESAASLAIHAQVPGLHESKSFRAAGKSRRGSHYTSQSALCRERHKYRAQRCFASGPGTPDTGEARKTVTSHYVLLVLFNRQRDGVKHRRRVERGVAEMHNEYGWKLSGRPKHQNHRGGVRFAGDHRRREESRDIWTGLEHHKAQHEGWGTCECTIIIVSR